MTKLTRAETANYLSEYDHYTILSHTRPDGDTVGSSAALCLGLRAMGKTAHVLYNDEVSPRFSWLHEGLTKSAAESGDTIVSVDVAAPGMLPNAFQPLLGSISLRIDHHGSATSFTELELVDPDSASCAEVVYDVLETMGCKMDAAILNAVYVGLSTDTGCFRFANTTAHTFQTAAVCAQGGAEIYRLNQELFETNSLGRLKMQAWIVENMHTFHAGSMAICAIPKSVEDSIGVNSDDMDNISNFPRSIAGVNMAATLREAADGTVKLSVRAVPGYDATVVTQKFGGGGHKGAAGASFRLSLEEAAAAVEAAMMEVCK